jgi:hypothetical protein
LAIRNHIGRFLELDNLLVSKARSVVYNLHGVGRLADGTRASCGFGDLATVYVHFDGMITHRTAEERYSVSVTELVPSL